MDNIYWYLAAGTIVEAKGKPYYVFKVCGEWVRLTRSRGLWFGEKVHVSEIKLTGIFDCMPEWAEWIEFCEDGRFAYFAEGKFDYETQQNEDSVMFPDDEWIDFHKCPEEWKGKTFEITDELRGLLND